MPWTDKCNFPFPKNWDEWEKEIPKPIFELYGAPEVTDITVTEYGPTKGVEVQPKWDLPEKIVIKVAITGAFFSKRQNPNHPITTQEILESAREALKAWAPAVHIHVRDPKTGMPTHKIELYREILVPLRKEFPDRILDACCVFGPTHHETLMPVEEGLIDITPVNTTAVYCGDSLLAPNPKFLMAKTHYLQEMGCKPEIAVYDTGDIDNAYRWLIKTGILEKPYYWIVLPALPGGSPASWGPIAMAESLTFMVKRIKEIDPESVIMVCCAGRAARFLGVQALLLGCHVRVGMEDTIYKWPHSDERITSNAEEFLAMKAIAENLGYKIATAEDYAKMIGLDKLRERKKKMIGKYPAP